MVDPIKVNKYIIINKMSIVKFLSILLMVRMIHLTERHLHYFDF